MKAYRLDSRQIGASKRTKASRTSALQSRGVTINDEMLAKYPNLEKFVDQLIGYSFGKNYKI